MNDQRWKTFSLVNEWVRFSDTKAATLLAIQGVLLGIFSQSDWTKYPDKLGCFPVVIGVVAILLTLISMFFAFNSLNPKLKLMGGNSPLFFGSIASGFKNSHEYQQHFDKTMHSEEAIAKELSGQIFVNSQIAMRKFTDVTYSLRWFMVAMFFWGGFTAANIIIGGQS